MGCCFSSTVEEEVEPLLQHQHSPHTTLVQMTSDNIIDLTTTRHWIQIRQYDITMLEDDFWSFEFDIGKRKDDPKVQVEDQIFTTVLQ